MKSKKSLLTDDGLIVEQNKNSLLPNTEKLYLESYSFTTTAAIIGFLDKKVCIILRDGRSFTGILRSFDQFVNLFLQDTIERIYINNKVDRKYGENFEGMIMIRGENVIMIGEPDGRFENKHLLKMTKISFTQAKKEHTQWELETAEKEKKKNEKFLRRGFYVNVSNSYFYY